MKGKIIYNPILQNMLNPLVLETYVEGNRTLKDSIKIPEVIGIQSIEYIRTNPSGDNVYSIKLTNGLSYEIIAPKGDDGVGVLSVKFTRTESNGDKVYTIKLSNGNNFEFVCPKGSPGTTNYNELENKPFIPTKVSELQNDSGYATSQQVQQQITNLINAAPQTLDTLKELADALGNDPNFSVTITNQLSNKADKNDLKPILLEAFEDFDIEAVSNQLNNGGRVVLVENDGGNIELSTYITSSQTNRVLYMQFTSISGITFDPYNIIDYVHYKWTSSSGWNMYEYEIPLTNKYDPVEFNLVRTQNNGVVTYNFGNAKFSKLKEAIDDGKIVHILLDNYCFKLDYQVDSQSYIFSSLIQDYGNNGVGVMEVYEGENDSIEASLEQNIFNYKQDTLVSGTNIKTINNQSLLGEGNIDIEGGASTWDEIEDKPTFATVATSGSYNDLSNKPTIPDVTGKADKVSSATNGHLAGLNASGNLTDSGIVPSTLVYQGANQGTVPSVDFNPQSDTVHVTAQTLSDPQKQQARTNIGAAGVNDIVGIPIVNHGTSDKGTSSTSYSIAPNTLHVWGEVDALYLSLTTGEVGYAQEYNIQFTSGSTATDLNLPSTIQWINNVKPENVVADAIYQVSILNGIGVIVKVDLSSSSS